MGLTLQVSLRRPMVVLVLLWLAFLVRGAWYCALLPAWEGYDEPFHFAALQHVASGQGMPQPEDRISLEVEKSLQLLPLPWMLQFQAIPGPITTHEEFWKLPPAERQQRIAAVRSLSPEDGRIPGSEAIINYESQQPPLYYWLLAIPLRWISALPLLTRVYFLRFAGLLLSSLVAPLTYWIARLVLRSDAQALGAVAVIVLAPELMINLARVSNESLAVVCYSAMLVAALYVLRQPAAWRGWLLTGAFLGCGLLTKSYVLSAVPGVLLLGFFAVGKQPSADMPKLHLLSAAARVTVALGLAMAIAGRWYWKVHAATGSWTGVNDEVATSRLSLVQKLAQVGHVNWKSGVLSITVSHVWFGAWSFLRVQNRVYVAAFIVMGVAACGVVLRLLRRNSPQQTRQILLLSAFYLCFWAGLAYHVLLNYLGKGVSATAGWYLYAAVAAEVVLLVWGLDAFVPARISLPAVAVGLAALDLYGMHALLMSYWAGMTVHVGDWVPPALHVAFNNLPMVFGRLAELKPEWLGVPELWILWAGYWAATVGTVAIVFALFRTIEPRP